MFIDEETEGQEMEYLVKVSHLGQPLADSGACVFNHHLLPRQGVGFDSKGMERLAGCFLNFSPPNGATQAVSVPPNPFSKFN